MKKAIVKKAEKVVVIEIPKPTNPTTVEELWMAIDLRFVTIETMLKERLAQPQGRGPKSTRSMTEADAKRIMVGDLKDKSIKECLTELGLSYGQVYSARGGYTFKTQWTARQALIK